MQGERAGQYWDLDEAAWVPIDGDPRWPLGAEELAGDPTVLDAAPAPSEPS